jgi:uroporphyrinogen decarboxylase
LAGNVDVVIFLTGVGVQYLLNQIDGHVDREDFLAALKKVRTLVRGPKPLAALRAVGCTPTLIVPEPNTWREVLDVLDQKLPIAGLVVAVQEYGRSNPHLLAGLAARGATVETVHVYDWDLPADTAQLQANVRRILAADVDVVMFTSAGQIANLLELARRIGLVNELKHSLQNIVVASIGPTTSEMLHANELPVDLEPQHPRLGQLVQETARRAAEILERKQRVAASVNRTAMPAERPQPEQVQQEAWYDSQFLRACRREKVDFTPIWLMRQAGRYLPEYRAIRKQTSFLELCKNPQLASEVMCRTVETLGVDAAIIFSDLLPILEPMGMELEFLPAEGPVIHNPLRQSGDVDRLVELESTDALHYVMETVRQTRADLPSHIPLIGFAGAPFTLASYAIEGGASRTFLHTKTFMYRDTAAWDALASRLTRAIVRYLNAQIAAGAQAVQLFDTWAGCLGPDDYRQFVLPYVARIIQQLDANTPVISFATGNPQLLPLLAEANPHVVGVDWRIGLADACELIGPNHAVQGNLEPLALLADRGEISRRAKQVLDDAAGRPGHIFNLGHGVVPQTPPENVRALVDFVHEVSAR